MECGVREVAGELHHVQPLIYRSSTAIIIFYGFLSNVDELAKRLEAEAEGPLGLSFNKAPAAKSRLFVSRKQHQTEAAEALLEVYLQTHSNDLLIMLSELQVCAFTGYKAGHQQCQRSLHIWTALHAMTCCL